MNFYWHFSEKEEGNNFFYSPSTTSFKIILKQRQSPSDEKFLVPLPLSISLL